MKIWQNLTLLLTLAGTIMLVFGLEVKKDKKLEVMILKKNTPVSLLGIALLIIACLIQIIML